MKLAILLLLVSVVSCGRRKEAKKCLSRHQKIMECYYQYNETHNPAYVNAVCGQQYPRESCYK